jgi:hypothetical protein
MIMMNRRLLMNQLLFHMLEYQVNGFQANHLHQMVRPLDTISVIIVPKIGCLLTRRKNSNKDAKDAIDIFMRHIYGKIVKKIGKIIKKNH